MIGHLLPNAYFPTPEWTEAAAAHRAKRASPDEGCTDISLRSRRISSEGGVSKCFDLLFAFVEYRLP
jgi:hypothetical protein